MANLVYDPTTLLGQTRFHAADTNITLDPKTQVVTDNAIFSDAELNYCLTLTGNVPELAAAKALRAAAADAAKMAAITKLGTLGNDETTIYEALLAMADALVAAAAVSPVVGSLTGDPVAGTSTTLNPPDPVFTQSSGAGTVPGTLAQW